MPKYEMVMSPISVCVDGEAEGTGKGSCDVGSQYFACQGSAGSLPLSQSHGFGAERNLLQIIKKKN